jgi:hypothetical protein
MATDSSGRPITKVYIDSQFRSDSNTQAGKFRFELAEQITTEDPCHVAVSDISIPHSFYNVSTHADKLYIRMRTSSNIPVSFVDHTVSLAHGNYSASQLAQLVSQALTNLDTPTYSCTFSATTNLFAIQEARGNGFQLFQIRGCGDRALMCSQGGAFQRLAP